ncbi:hypothetical protein [Luteimonas huabeiensis]|uniref:hypothetical protein n=1 Tax=Luteimonas huabeiensis TaxID=1244513 RepID=UPI0004670E85|nr:hypothetical protein [Luteimonas huabeiensis]
MSDAIGFLDTMGRGAFAADPGAAYAAAVEALQIDASQREALRARDGAALGRLLRARALMMCMVATPDQGETEGPLDSPDRDEEDDRDDRGDRDGIRFDPD